MRHNMNRQCSIRRKANKDEDLSKNQPFSWHARNMQKELFGMKS